MILIQDIHALPIYSVRYTLHMVSYIAGCKIFVIFADVPASARIKTAKK